MQTIDVSNLEPWANGSIAATLLMADAEDAGMGDPQVLSNEQLQGKEDERRAELISNFMVTVHRQPRGNPKSQQHKDEKFNGRNIGIALMPLLEDHIEVLKADFLASEDGLAMEAFADLLFDRLHELLGDRVPAMFKEPEPARTALYELFGAIEHGGTGTIHWDAFFSYCIDGAIMGRTGFDIKSIVKVWGPKYLTMLRDKEPLERVKYSKHLQRVMCITREGTFKLLNPTNFSLSKAMWPITGKVIAMEYIKEYDRIAISSSDMCLRIFDTAGRYEELNMTHSQLCLSWCPRTGRLFSGCRTGCVYVWQLTGGGSERLTIKKVFTFQPHTAPVTDMIGNPLDGSIITSSLDKTIVVSDPHYGRELQRYLGHNAGVVRIDFTPDYNLLISGAMETKVLVWLFGGGDNPKPFELIDPDKPHRYSICSVSVVPHSPQFVSLDIKGMLKFWDIRTFSCTQTMYTAHTDMEKQYLFSDACVIGMNTYLSCSSKKTYLYEVDQSSIGKDRRCDDTVVTQSCHTASGTLVTVAEKNVKTWDVTTGEMLTNYTDIAAAVQGTELGDSDQAEQRGHDDEHYDKVWRRRRALSVLDRKCMASRDACPCNLFST